MNQELCGEAMPFCQAHCEAHSEKKNRQLPDRVAHLQVMKSCLYFFPPLILVRTNKRYDVFFQILPYVARPSSPQQHLSVSACGQSCAAGSGSPLQLPSAPAVVSLSPRCCPCSPCAGRQQPKDPGDVWSLVLQLCVQGICWKGKRPIVLNME